jgi:hypothetical protein
MPARHDLQRVLNNEAAPRTSTTAAKSFETSQPSSSFLSPHARELSRQSEEHQMAFAARKYDDNHAIRAVGFNELWGGACDERRPNQTQSPGLKRSLHYSIAWKMCQLVLPLTNPYNPPDTDFHGGDIDSIPVGDATTFSA